MKLVTLLAMIGLLTAPVQPARASKFSAATLLRVDWQEPLQLPPRFRNHCRAENFTNRPYCSDHCGSDYQFYFCSDASFGCCHLGRGYCDINGLVRCHP